MALGKVRDHSRLLNVSKENYNLTLSWPTSERYVGWPGQGKFSLPYYLPKYLSNHHQTWQYGSVSDEDQKNPNKILK